MTRGDLQSRRVRFLIRRDGKTILLDGAILVMDNPDELDAEGNPVPENIKALVDHNERGIENRPADDGSVELAKATVFYFDSRALGKIKQGQKLTVDGINYKTDGPLHPEYLGEVCVYLAIPTVKW